MVIQDGFVRNPLPRRWGSTLGSVVVVVATFIEEMFFNFTLLPYDPNWQRFAEHGLAQCHPSEWLDNLTITRSLIYIQ